MAGRGSLFSWTVVYRSELPGFSSGVPYGVAVVQLERPEGIRMLGRIVETELGKLTIGAPMEVRFQIVANSIALPVWRLIEGV